MLFPKNDAPEMVIHRKCYYYKLYDKSQDFEYSNVFGLYMTSF